jgi:hypothetical protein
VPEIPEARRVRAFLWALVSTARPGITRTSATSPPSRKSVTGPPNRNGMNAKRIERLVRAWLLRASVAVEDGGPLDPVTEFAAAQQCLAEILAGCTRIESERAE